MPDEFQLAGITRTIFRGSLMVSWRFPLVRRCVSCSLGGPAPICTIQNGWRKLAESGCFSCLIKPAHVSMELFFDGDCLNHRIFIFFASIQCQQCLIVSGLFCGEELAVPNLVPDRFLKGGSSPNPPSSRAKTTETNAMHNLPCR